MDSEIVHYNNEDANNNHKNFKNKIYNEEFNNNNNEEKTINVDNNENLDETTEYNHFIFQGRKYDDNNHFSPKGNVKENFRL